jgi:hypothetical protein
VQETRFQFAFVGDGVCCASLETSTDTFFSFLGGSADEKKQEIIFIVSIELKERERERLRN